MIVGRLGIHKSGFISDPPGGVGGGGGGGMHSNATKLTNYCCGCSEKHHQGYNNNNNNIPKLEAFSRSKFDRVLKDPPLISKSQNQLADYCTLLQGEDSYSCWQAYFELKHLEKEYSKEQLEKLIIEAGGVKSLIGCLHGVASILKHNTTHTHTHSSPSPTATTNTQQHTTKLSDEPQHMHVPDGLPKTALEMEEEDNSRMPDSAYTRLLRFNTPQHPPWY